MEETLSNDRFISLHRNQIDPIPNPMSTLTFAYGNLRYGNLLLINFLEMLDQGLKSDDDLLRTKVLVEINEDFHQADKLNFALESSILQSLLTCFSHKEANIRELASRAVLKIANTEMGRVVFIQNSLIELTA